MEREEGERRNEGETVKRRREEEGKSTDSNKVNENEETDREEGTVGGRVSEWESE